MGSELHEKMNFARVGPTGANQPLRVMVTDASASYGTVQALIEIRKGDRLLETLPNATIHEALRSVKARLGG